jgi:hypothetical protein
MPEDTRHQRVRTPQGPPNGRSSSVPSRAWDLPRPCSPSSPTLYCWCRAHGEVPDLRVGRFPDSVQNTTNALSSEQAPSAGQADSS